jgi:hypothetical protein
LQNREEQIELEEQHRREEDRLYRQFQEQRDKEHTKVHTGIQEEWEVELEKLTAKFERELSKKKNKDDYKVLTVRHHKEKEEFEKNMTLKRDKKKDHVSKKLLEHERLVSGHISYFKKGAVIRVHRCRLLLPDWNAYTFISLISSFLSSELQRLRWLRSTRRR